MKTLARGRRKVASVLCHSSTAASWRSFSSVKREAVAEAELEVDETLESSDVASEVVVDVATEVVELAVPTAADAVEGEVEGAVVEGAALWEAAAAIASHTSAKSVGTNGFGSGRCSAGSIGAFAHSVSCASGWREMENLVPYHASTKRVLPAWAGETCVLIARSGVSRESISRIRSGSKSS
eukprot:6175811-Pleurochrysis_carterae.AAC.3